MAIRGYCGLRSDLLQPGGRCVRKDAQSSRDINATTTRPGPRLRLPNSDVKYGSVYLMQYAVRPNHFPTPLELYFGDHIHLDSHCLILVYYASRKPV